MAEVSGVGRPNAHIVDGNAVAGVLGTLGERDASELVVECGGCGATALLGAWVVEADEAAFIVRCRACSHTLCTILHDGDRVTVRVAGPCSIRTAP